MVHPVPLPPSIYKDITISTSAAGINQYLMLLRRGKTISIAPNIKGINQLPKPPIIIGITTKKIIINP